MHNIPDVVVETIICSCLELWPAYHLPYDGPVILRTELTILRQCIQPPGQLVMSTHRSVGTIWPQNSSTPNTTKPYCAWVGSYSVCKNMLFLRFLAKTSFDNLTSHLT
eukprot:11115-Amphidinium_carterae.1